MVKIVLLTKKTISASSLPSKSILEMRQGTLTSKIVRFKISSRLWHLSCSCHVVFILFVVSNHLCFSFRGWYLLKGKESKNSGCLSGSPGLYLSLLYVYRASLRQWQITPRLKLVVDVVCKRALESTFCKAKSAAHNMLCEAFTRK